MLAQRTIRSFIFIPKIPNSKFIPLIGSRVSKYHIPMSTYNLQNLF